MLLLYIISGTFCYVISLFCHYKQTMETRGEAYRRIYGAWAGIGHFFSMWFYYFMLFRAMPLLIPVPSLWDQVTTSGIVVAVFFFIAFEILSVRITKRFYKEQ